MSSKNKGAKRGSEKPPKEEKGKDKNKSKDDGDAKKRHGSVSNGKDGKELKEAKEAIAAIPAKPSEPRVIDDWKYEGEVPPPLPANYPYKYEDLPADVRKIYENKSLGLDKATLEKYFNHAWTVGRFLMRESFPENTRTPVVERPKVEKKEAKEEKKDGDDKKDEPKPEVKTESKPKEKKVQPRNRPYALDSQIEHAKSIVLVSEKSMKKLFKGNDKAGEGGFGEVFVAKDLSTKSGKEKVAVKRIPHDNPKVQENNWTEIAFLSMCKHPNVVEFKRAYLVKEDKKAPEEMWVVMEYLEGGNLAEAAAANALSEDHIAFVAHEILAALKYLHERKWVHRDLKSANVMMSIKGEIKLIDFGLCADFSEGPRTQMLGSPYWIPPEMIWQVPHYYPADIWSMGVCILELLLCHPPHNDSNLKAMFLVATRGLIDQIPSEVSTQGKAFLARCLILDPEKRPGPSDLLKDPWVTRPNLNKGIDEVLRQVFLSASFSTLGF